MQEAIWKVVSGALQPEQACHYISGFAMDPHTVNTYLAREIAPRGKPTKKKGKRRKGEVEE
jgi:hypothetical protein